MPAKEQVTFQILPVSQIKRPPWPVVAGHALRMNLLTLSLSPVLVTLIYLLSVGTPLSWPYFASSALAIFFLHSAVFLLNDYYDHVRGADQSTEGRGSQVIQKGWIPAYRIKYAAWGALALGAVTGIPAVWDQPRTLSLVAAFAVFGIVSYSYKAKGLKYIGWGDVIIFLCSGPLLTFGVAQAAGHYYDGFILWTGLVLGAFSTITYHCRQFENLFAEREARSGTLMARMGFDRGRYLLLVELIGGLILGGILAFGLGGVSLLFVLLGWDFYQLMKSIYHSHSPVSSKLNHLSKKAASLHFRFSAVLSIVIYLGHWGL